MPNSFVMQKNITYCIFLFLLLSACQKKQKSKSNQKNQSQSIKAVTKPKLFKLLSANESGIKFTNSLKIDAVYNHVYWESIYNGGGVALGDLNNDGLTDIYFAGNQELDKIYMNNGNLNFTDVTENSGISNVRTWSSGITFVDINNDDLLDIYVCKFGPFTTLDYRKNELYINLGNNKFSEEAEKYGLDDRGNSIQATFFDYDKDGDLDMYLINQPSNLDKVKSTFTKDITQQENKYFKDRLYKNNNGKYTDVTKSAGINNFAYGLGLVTADINNDGYPDIYVANDYDKPDNIWINNKNGTFTDKAKLYLKKMSQFSMGADVADFNNDGLHDILTADMGYDDHFRSKTNMGSMSEKAFWKSVNSGNHYQYMINALQVNNGNGTFSEVSQLMGLSKTDWSWATLMADFDNDGYKDIFITNGIREDIRNNDVSDYLQQKAKNQGSDKLTLDLDDLVKWLPSVKPANKMYKNNGDFSFTESAADWGLSKPFYSNGAAYGDLDNDGDLDLVINNIDEPSVVYENKSSGNNYLQFKPSNESFVNGKIILTMGSSTQFIEYTNSRGYLSAVDEVIHFGLGNNATVDKVEIIWPNGKKQELKNVKANQQVAISSSNANLNYSYNKTKINTIFKKTNSVNAKHQENDFDAFKDEILLPNKQSEPGPCIATGDVNGDGLADIYIGGAMGFSGQLGIQSNGKFKFISQNFSKHKSNEDVAATFFDLENDGDLDLYVVSGAYESNSNQDRVYINNGKGDFSESIILPENICGGAVKANDFDKDGFIDLFIAGRAIPQQYPKPASSYLLKNINGKLSNVTKTIMPEAEGLGMINDAIWSDYDGDGDDDLLMAGEWTPIILFVNNNGQFKRDKAFMPNSNGWWYSLQKVDIDGDGDDDYLAGNLGTNNKFHPKKSVPFNIWANDFDDNGTLDIVLAKGQTATSSLPVRGRECSSQQMPFIEQKFNTYEAFANANIKDLYGDKLKDALNYSIEDFTSIVIINEKGKLKVKPLPIQAQVAPIKDFVVDDFNNDGNMDVLLAGNLWGAEVETPRYDAGIGVTLLGDGKGNFAPLNNLESGFFADGNVQSLALVKLAGNKKMILVGNNNDNFVTFQYESNSPTASK